METEEILAAIQKAANTIATPNWAAVLSAFAAILAVVVAGVVAWKQYGISKKQNEIVQRQVELAEQQNKIALFEKKYSVYCELFKIVNVGDQLDYSEPHTRFSLLHEIEVIYGVDFSIGQDTTAQLAAVLTQIKRSEYIIRQSIFLFDCIKETDISELINALMSCMIFIVRDSGKVINIENHDIKEFIKIRNEFSIRYLDSIELELNLK